MRLGRLSNNVKIARAIAPSVGAAGTMTAIEVDGTGYNRAMWIVETGVAATGAKLNAKVQSASASGGSFSDVTNAKITELLAATGASKVCLIDMPVGDKPFMKMVLVTSVDDFANSATCVLYRALTSPVDTSYAKEVVVL